MNCLKTILTTSILLSVFLLRAQNRLDDISLNLPSEYNWIEKGGVFKNDSTVCFQSWFVKNNEGQNILKAAIISKDNEELRMQLQDHIDKRLQSNRKGRQVILLEKSKTSGGYPYALLKVIIAKEKGESNEPGSLLTILIQTQTSLHFCIARTVQSKLSDVFVERWSSILKHPEIIPGTTEKARQTQFVLTTPKTKALCDSSVAKQLRRRFQVRLEDVYRRNLLPKDIKFDEGRIYITLRGNIDEAKIAKLLEENASVQFLPLYQDMGYQKFAREADSLFNVYKAQNQEKIPTGFYESHLPKVVVKIPFETQKELLPKLKKLLKQQDLSKSLRLYGSPEENGSTLIYLVDTRVEVLNETNIENVQVVFGSEGYPSLQIRFEAEGRKKTASWTENHIGEFLAIVVDSKVYVAPKIHMPITKGVIQISGASSLAESSNLRNAILLSYPIPITVETIKKL